MLATLAAALLARSAVALTIVCDGTACARGGNTCLVACGSTGTCTIGNAYTAPAGCVLDFGDRDVVFRNTFDVGRATLSVKARSIAVQGQLRARSDGADPGGTIELVATGSSGHAGNVVVSGRLDATGRPGGTIRLRTAEALDVQATATVVANGNATTANGGSVIAEAGSLVRQAGPVAVIGGNQAGGGMVTVRAGTTLDVLQRIDATGGAGDGGDVDLSAGDDLTVLKPIDVSSTNGASGGSISARAGVDALGGVAAGGALTIAATLKADATSDADGGYDGGDITLSASGPIAVSGAIRAIGSAPDGSGGSLVIDSGDAQPDVVTALDGDVALSAPIILAGAASDGDGGALTITAGRSLTVASTATIDVTGADAGDVAGIAGRHLALNASIAAATSDTTSDGDGGTVTLIAGAADGGATLSIASGVGTRAGPRGLGGDQLYAGCAVTVQRSAAIDAGGGASGSAARVDVAAPGSLTFATGARITAMPAGTIVLTHGGTLNGVTTSTFAPSAIDRYTAASPLYPLCPVRTVTMTPTSDPTPTGAATAPSRTPTPARTPTPSVTAAAPTVSAIATPSPSSTTLPVVASASLVRCERAMSRAAAVLGDAYAIPMQRCALGVLSCAGRTASERERCIGTLRDRCAKSEIRAARAQADAAEAVEQACGGNPPRIPIALLRASAGLGFETLEPACRDEAELSLTSLGAIVACTAALLPCRAGRALGMAIPRVADLLGSALQLDTSALCLSDAAVTEMLTPTGGREALRCQRALASTAAAALRRRASTARRCVDGLFACRLTGRADAACAALALRCRSRLDALDLAASTKLGAAMTRACSRLPAAEMLSSTGLAFAQNANRCARLGISRVESAADVAACLARSTACDASAIVRVALPFGDALLRAFGVPLAEPFCDAEDETLPASPSPTAPPTPSSTPSVLPTSVPTPSDARTPSPAAATATASPPPDGDPEPTATPAPEGEPICGNGVVDPGEECDFGDVIDGDGCSARCAFELLVPGGGRRRNDCAAEWAAINPTDDLRLGRDGLPGPQRCVDGDPTCDAGGTVDGTCRFRVALCFGVVDPRLPECVPAPLLRRITLQKPRATAGNAVEAANATAIADAVRAWTAIAPEQGAGTVFVADPPLVVGGHRSCTPVADVVVPLRGSGDGRAILRVLTEWTVDDVTRMRDRDTLRLVCGRPQ